MRVVWPKLGNQKLAVSVTLNSLTVKREKVQLGSNSSAEGYTEESSEEFVLLTAEQTGVPLADLDLRRRNPTLTYLNPPYFR